MTTLIKKKHTYTMSGGKTAVNLWKPKEGKENQAACKALLKDNSYRAVKGDPLGSGKNKILYLFYCVLTFLLQSCSATCVRMSFLLGVICGSGYRAWRSSS